MRVHTMAGRRAPVAVSLLVLSFGTILFSWGVARGDATWTGAGADDKWSTGPNWDPAGPPASGDTQRLTFMNNLQATSKQDIADPYIVNEMTLSGGAAAFTFSGQKIRFAGTSPILKNISAKHQVFENAIELAKDLQVICGSKNISLSGVVSGDKGFEINSGSGRFELTGSAKNTYAGKTFLESGILDLSKLVGNGATDNTSVPGELEVGTGNGRATVSLSVSHQIGDASTVTLHADAGLDMTYIRIKEKFKALRGDEGATIAFEDLDQFSELTVEEGDYAGTFVGVGGLVQLGTEGSVLKLSGNSPFEGDVTIKGGTMKVTGQLGTDEKRLRSLTIGTDGSLEGTGKAFLRPTTKVRGLTRCKLKIVGNSPAIFTIDGGGLDLDPGAIFEVEIDGTTPGNGAGHHSQLVVKGDVDIDRGELHVLLDSPPSLGQRYAILANDAVDSIVGTFAGLAQDTVFPVSLQGTPYYFQIDYSGDASDGSPGNDVILTRVNVPALPGEAVHLTVARTSGSEPSPTLALSWDASCSGVAVDYGIYEGIIGSWYSHQPIDCTDGLGDLHETIQASSGNRYYLVVPRDLPGASREGSYGRASDGSERPRGTTVCAPSQSLGLQCP